MRLTRRRWLVTAGLMLFLLIAAWGLRYEVVECDNRPTGYCTMINRWTGEVLAVQKRRVPRPRVMRPPITRPDALQPATSAVDPRLERARQRVETMMADSLGAFYVTNWRDRIRSFDPDSKLGFSERLDSIVASLLRPNYTAEWRERR